MLLYKYKKIHFFNYLKKKVRIKVFTVYEKHIENILLNIVSFFKCIFELKSKGALVKESDCEKQIFKIYIIVIYI